MYLIYYNLNYVSNVKTKNNGNRQAARVKGAGRQLRGTNSSLPRPALGFLIIINTIRPCP